MSERFSGIPTDAVDFYRDLAGHNTREWWAGQGDRYTTSVREPLLDLMDALEREFGEAKVFRPHRDVRFSHDKTPYKDNQAAVVQPVEGSGYYLQLSADGLMTGGGAYYLAADQVRRYRDAVDAPAIGAELQKRLKVLQRKGMQISGETLKTRPRGVDPDHPRLELMRHKSLWAYDDHGVPDWMSTPAVATEVARSWRRLRPLNDWFAEHVGASETPPDLRRPG